MIFIFGLTILTKNHAIPTTAPTFPIILWVPRDSSQRVEVTAYLTILIMQSHTAVFRFTKQSWFWT